MFRHIKIIHSAADAERMEWEGDYDVIIRVRPHFALHLLCTPFTAVLSRFSSVVLSFTRVIITLCNPKLPPVNNLMDQSARIKITLR